MKDLWRAMKMRMSQRHPQAGNNPLRYFTLSGSIVRTAQRVVITCPLS
jgi:hypothetical protein